MHEHYYCRAADGMTVKYLTDIFTGHTKVYGHPYGPERWALYYKTSREPEASRHDCNSCKQRLLCLMNPEAKVLYESN